MIFKSVPLMHLSSSDQPRPLVPDDVAKLASSISSVGLIFPIIVQEFGADSAVMNPTYKIVAGHHRVAAARSLGWTEIDAIITDTSGLQAELIEIDENLCRAELTNPQRIAFTARRAQIWDALNPKEKPVAVAKEDVKLEVGQIAPPQVAGTHGGVRPQTKGFAAATAEATGQSKRDTNKALAIANAVGIATLEKLSGTSLESGVELDALARLPEPERAALVERAVAGEQVSARPKTVPPEPTPEQPTGSRIEAISKSITDALDGVLRANGCRTRKDVVDLITNDAQSGAQNNYDTYRVGTAADELAIWADMFSAFAGFDFS